VVTSPFPRFIAVGATATALQYAILLLTVELGGMSPTPASSLGFVISAVFNYLANKHVTFETDTPNTIAGPRFVAMVLLGLIVTSLCMRTLTSFGVHYLLAQVLTTALVLTINFRLASRWVFRRAVKR
jgi:putative flippase GtrA